MFGFKKNSKKEVYRSFIEKGDIVTAGSYKNVPITWIVLEVEEEHVLLLSQFLLTLRCYDAENYLVKGQFDTLKLPEWFDQSMIEECGLREGLMKKTVCMDDKEHALFILSDQQIAQYLPDKESRVTSEHKARLKGGVAKPGWWWTSTKGTLRNTMNFVDKDGTLKTERFQDNAKGGIRPAMWLDVHEAEKNVKKPEQALAEYKALKTNAFDADDEEAVSLAAKKEMEEKSRKEAAKTKRTAFENRMSAKEFYDQAENLLELASVLGDDGPKGAAKYAIKYLEISAKSGYTPAMRKLAFLYENGIGCEVDERMARKYLDDAK